MFVPFRVTLFLLLRQSNLKTVAPRPRRSVVSVGRSRLAVGGSMLLFSPVIGGSVGTLAPPLVRNWLESISLTCRVAAVSVNLQGSVIRNARRRRFIDARSPVITYLSVVMVGKLTLGKA